MKKENKRSSLQKINSSEVSHDVQDIIAKFEDNVAQMKQLKAAVLMKSDQFEVLHQDIQTLLYSKQEFLNNPILDYSAHIRDKDKLDKMLSDDIRRQEKHLKRQRRKVSLLEFLD